MKTQLLLAALFLLGLSGHSQNLQWVKAIGGPAPDVSNAIATDNSGNVYTTGSCSGLVTFSNAAGGFTISPSNGRQAFVAKQDSLGNYIWVKQLGGANTNTEGTSVKVDNSGNVYTCGIFTGIADLDPGAGTCTLQSTNAAYNAFVSRLDAAGNFIWAAKLGGPGTSGATALALDAAGNVLVTGLFAGSCDFDPGAATYTLASSGRSDMFIAKLDASGSFVWAKKAGSPGDEESNAIATDASGNIYTTGYYNAATDFDPGAGAYTLGTAAMPDVFVLKLDASGGLVWARGMGGHGVDIGYGVCVDANANVYTTGYSTAAGDFDPGAGTYSLTAGGIFISKLNAAGDFVWAKGVAGMNAAGALSTAGYGISLDQAGNVYNTGYYAGPADFDPGFGVYSLNQRGTYVLKLDASGNFAWAAGFDGSTEAKGSGVVPDHYGNVYATGYFAGSYDFDPDLNTTWNIASAQTTNDLYVVKLGRNATTGLGQTNALSAPLHVYPNPNNGAFTIEAGGDMSLVIVNSLGQPVAEIAHANTMSVALADLAPGIYFITGQAAGRPVKQKMVVVK